MKSNGKRAVGRPRSDRKLVKVVAYMDARVRARIQKAARAARAGSVSSWAVEVLEREANRTLGGGEVPLSVLDLPRGTDPTGVVRKAVRDERDAGW